MRLSSLLRTPPPVHAFALGTGQVLYGRLSRRRDALARVEAAPLMPDWFHLGPVGLLQVDQLSLTAGLTALLGRLEKPPETASLVVPDCWVRSVLIEVGSLPRQRDEAETIVRWRLKKLLPCRPEEVRLDFKPVPQGGRVLVLLALDRPFTHVEEAFAAAGIEIGRIEPTVLALSGLLPSSTTPALLATLEERALAIALLARGKTLVVRHKPLPSDVHHAEAFVVRELARTLAHARDKEKLADRLEVWLAGVDQERCDEVERWAERAGGVEVHRLAMAPGLVPKLAGVADVPVWSLLATAWEGAG
jgi:hypothetical protein